MKKEPDDKILKVSDLKIIRLDFKGKHAQYEKGFVQYFLSSSLDLSLLTLFLSSIIYVLFGFLDYTLFPLQYLNYWLIRLIIVTSIITIALLMKSKVIKFKYHQLFLFSLMTLAGVGIAYMLCLTEDKTVYYYFAGIMLVIFTGYSFIRLRFSLGLLSGIIILLSMNYFSIIIAEFPLENIIIENFFVISSFLLSSYVGFSIEFSKRQEYLLKQKLKEQSEKISKLNDNLGEEIELRTEALIKTNKQLKDEIEERLRLEAAEDEHKKNIYKLAKSALSFLKHENQKNVFNLIGESLQDFTNGNIIVLSRIEDKTSMLEAQHIFGIESIFEKVMNMVDFDFLSKPILCNEAKISALKTGKLTNMNIDLYEYLLEKVPRNICKILAKLINLDKIYTIGFNWQGRVFGSADILVCKDKPLNNFELIEAYAAQASIAIQRSLVEKELAESEKWHRAILETQGEGVAITNFEEEITFCNPMAERIFGVPEHSLIGRNLKEFIHDDQFAKITDESEKRMKGESSEYEISITREDGSIMHLLITATPIIKKGEITSTLGIFRDITERKVFENKLQRSLNEKQVLIKEIHHRVKNNMQIISSLIRMQTRSAENPEVIDNLITSQNRVQSMAIIHEKLYQSDDFTSVNLNNYITQLIGQLANTFGNSLSKIRFENDVDRINLNINLAVPCGLIINEIISNSIKYAFPGENKGIIRTTFKKSNENYILTISDNGIGLPENFDYRKCKSLGMQIINTLTQQLHGSLETISDNGLTYVLTFDNPDLKSYNSH